MNGHVGKTLTQKREHTIMTNARMGALLIVLVSLAYSSLYFFNTFPISEGWNVNYAELFLRGNMPYRDFYYYLPPLSLFLDTIFWKLSFGFLIVYRFWYLVQRIAIYILFYRLLCRYFNWKYAAISCAIAEILCTAEVYDLFGDYNQTVSFLGVLLAYASVNFVHTEETRKKVKNLFLAGIVLGLMFLCKQTIVLAAFLVYIVALIVYCLINRDKNFLWYVLSTAVGALVPIGLVAIWLAANGALFPYIHQVFLSVSGKGSILRIAFEGISLVLLHADLWVLALLFFAMVYLPQKSEEEFRRRGRISIAAILVAILLLVVKFKLLDYFNVVAANIAFVAVIAVGALPTIVLFFFRKRMKNFGRWWNGALFFWCVFLLVGLLCNKNVLCSIAENNFFSLIESQFDTIAFYLQLFILAYLLVKRIKMGPSAKKMEELAMLCCAGISVAYASTMAAAGGVIVPHAVIFITPLVLCYVFSELTQDTILCGFKYILYGFCMILITITCAQKATCSYSWWGTQSKPMWEKNYSTQIRALQGFTFSKKDQEMYDTITTLVTENSDEDDVIFGYPFIKIFNILCNRYESTLVPVLWYDVVGDGYVEETLYELEQNPPDIVIWRNDIPGALQVHETQYRGGEPLVQRKLENYLKGIFPVKYDLLGTVNDIQVYKLKEEEAAKPEQPVMDGNAAIQWIEENVHPVVIGDYFAGGTGTKEDPYLVQTCDHLVNLQALVNMGYTFKDMYIRQEQDLDFTDSTIAPIGKGDAPFEGVYDGAGHVIRNLTIYGKETDAAGLFSITNGKIYNLGLEGGFISGGNCGAIAACAPGKEGLIVNCYTDITVQAQRAGGLTDNFAGDVLNSFSVGELTGIDGAGAISFNNTANVDLVFEAKENVASVFDTESNIELRVSRCTEETLNSEVLLKKMNDYVDAWNKKLEEAGTDDLQNVNNKNEQDMQVPLVQWKLGDDGHLVFDRSAA